jgi:CHAD domain-containing protein
MATTTEVERKYEVPVDFRLPNLTTVPGVADVGDPVEQRLDATYFDTTGLRLAAAGVTLRRREGGHDAGWHLKRPAGGDRTETREPLSANSSDVPAALVDSVRAETGDEPLAPVARMRTRRLERPVRDRDGRVLAVVADDVVDSETVDEPAAHQQWRELEVELVEGPREVLDAVDELLRTAGATPARAPSKLAHALADRYPDKATGDEATDDKASDVGEPAGPLASYLAEQRNKLHAMEPGVREFDADAVHDMRVAIRRLRATLRTFRPLLDAARSERLRSELRWLGGVLGTVRDGDVLAERIGATLAELPPELVVGPVAARVRQRLTAGTAAAREELVAALDGDRYRVLLDSLDALVATVPTHVPSKRLRGRARRALRRADHTLDAADEDTALHEARKAYKRARYAVELLEPVAGKRARRLVRRLTALQDMLGTHQDAVVASQVLREYGMRANLDGENAFTYGLLVARHQQAGADALAQLPRARRRAGRRRLRRVVG